MLGRAWRKGNPPTLLWECRLVQPLWKTVWRFLKKLKIELPYDLANPLLGIYRRKLIWKDTCTRMFIAAPFTIAKTWNQPECPSTDEWIKKMWYINTTEYYSAIKKNEIMQSAATWMDLEMIILNEVRKRKINIIRYHLYVESEIWYKWTYSQNKKKTHRHIKQTYGYQRGK